MNKFQIGDTVRWVIGSDEYYGEVVSLKDHGRVVIQWDEREPGDLAGYNAELAPFQIWPNECEIPL